MRIIKHKTRRRAWRSIERPDQGYYVVEGALNVGSIEEAAEAMEDGWRAKLREAPRAKTLWEAYPRMQYKRRAHYAATLVNAAAKA
jgi:hypothetical protein